MKPILTALSVLIFSVAAISQIKAVTQTGDEVILNLNGTWKYTSDSVKTEKILDTVVTSKPANAKFFVKSEKVSFGVWIDSKKWKFKKETDGTREYMFSLNGEDAYAMFIPEKIEIPMESWKQIAVENAQKVATNVSVISEQMRKVNGLTVYCMQLNGTIQGIKFTYYGYYFSSDAGSIQFITYTSQKLFAQYKPALEELLNGFAESN